MTASRAALFVLVLALLALIAPREPWSGEARALATTARALAASGTLDVAPMAAEGAIAGTRVHEGRRYRSGPPAAALVLVPAEALGLLAPRAPWVRALAGGVTAAALVALLCVVFLGHLRRAGVGEHVALAAALALGLASGLVAAGRIPDGGALAALLLLLSVGASRGPGRGAALTLGLGAAALVLTDPVYLPAAGVLTIAAAWRHRRRPTARIRALACVGPLLLSAGGLALYRHLTGYVPDPPGDIVEGIYGLTLSTGKSLVLYTPLLLLLIWALPVWWRTRRGDAAVSLAAIVGVLLALGAQPGWHGDPAWGPRRALPLVPLLAEPIALWIDGAWARLRLRMRALVVGLALAGAGVQLVGAAFAPTAYLRISTAVRHQSGAPVWFADPPSHTHFIPQLSPLVGQAWLLSHHLRGDKALGADPPFRLLMPTVLKLDAEAAQLRLDWWALAAPRLAAALVAVALVAAAAGAVYALFRRRGKVLT